MTTASNLVEMPQSNSKPVPELQRESMPPSIPVATKLNPAELMPIIRRTVLDSTLDIIAGLIEVAKNGNHLPAKFLFELAGLEVPQETLPSDEHEKSLTELLFREIDKATE